MIKYKINGPTVLKGEVEISGAKNSILALMAATLLAEGKYEIDNIPYLVDINTMSQVLETIGVSIDREDNKLFLETSHCQNLEAPYDLVSKMRASIYVMGPLLAKYGEVKVSLPGGCAWGPRPIDFHIEAMKKLGAEVTLEHGYIHARAKKLKGAKISFDTVSVGATANVLMAATLAEGTTTIINAAAEPEITDLANFLIKMGAKIIGAGTSRIVINGVDKLKSINYTAIPDRIEAGTFMVGAFLSRGDVTVKNVNIEHLASTIDKLEEAGAIIETSNENVKNKSSVRVKYKDGIKPIKILTAPYPGFPTDMQAQFMAMLSVADGTSSITEGIYHDRFMHVMELMRMGASINLEGNVAVITGKKNLAGANVMASDLRASAALVLAAIVADGYTTITRIYHIERGYENFDIKLNKLGASIEKLDTV